MSRTMKALDLAEVQQYANENVDDFHKRRIGALEKLRLNRLLAKNPYLFRAKNIVTAGELVIDLLDAFLSSSEEKLFGDFLEGLALFIAEKTSGGHKSGIEGMDLEFITSSMHYVVSIKSGTNWGNSSQHAKLEQDFKRAATVIRQSTRAAPVQPVLGICYGKTRTVDTGVYLKVVGQNFWYLISGNRMLYTEIVEPIGYRAKEHNDLFFDAKARLVNRFTREFLERFCDSEGAIDWPRLVEFNSGNLDLDAFLTSG